MVLTSSTPWQLARIVSRGCTSASSGACVSALIQHANAFSIEGAARSSESASTAGRDSAKPADGKGTAKGKGAGAGGASAPAPSAAAAAAAAAAASSYLQPSRLGLYTRTILQRELMLKLQPRSWDALPRLTAIEVSIPAIETQLERDVVDKSELLLYALALEVLAGKPAGFTAPANKALGTRATGVAVRLDAVTEPEAAHLFMEKLVHVLLPNQVGFEGVPPPMLVPPPRRSKAAEAAQARKAALDHRKAPAKAHFTEIKVGNLLTYPDFEQNFSLFEPLRGMRVRLVMEGASAADCAALLGGMSLPVLSGAAAEAALADITAEVARRARG